MVVMLHGISVMLPAAGSPKAVFDSSSLCLYAQHRAQLHCFLVLGHSLHLLQLLLSHLGAHNSGSDAVWLVMQIKDLGVKAQLHCSCFVCERRHKSSWRSQHRQYYCLVGDADQGPGGESWSCVRSPKETLQLLVILVLTTLAKLLFG